MTNILVLLAELATWIFGAAATTETFSFFRVQGQLGVGGFVLAAIAGGMAMGAAGWRPRWPMSWLALSALLLHLAFVDLPQAQPDTITWFTLAQTVQRDPSVLLRWPSVAWGGDAAPFHTPLPLVPAVYALAWAIGGESPRTTDVVLTLWAVALPLAVAWAGTREGKPAVLAGLVAMTTPLLAAQQGWMLADIPLTVLVTLALASRGRMLAAGAAVLTKPSAALFLAPRIVPRRWLVLAAVLGYAALAIAHPPRMREDPATWGLAALSLVVYLRPVLLARADLASLLVLPALVLWAPADHVARYALPLVQVLAIGLARAAPRLAAFTVGSGLAILLGGFRPTIVHHQAANVQQATRALVESGATGIEVAICTRSGFAAEGLAALVDYYAPVPVMANGTIQTAPLDPKRHWWQSVTSPPWRHVEHGDAAIIGDCDHTPPGWHETGRFEQYQGSSPILPRVVITYARTPDAL